MPEDPEMATTAVWRPILNGEALANAENSVLEIADGLRDETSTRSRISMALPEETRASRSSITSWPGTGQSQATIRFVIAAGMPASTISPTLRTPSRASIADSPVWAGLRRSSRKGSPTGTRRTNHTRRSWHTLSHARFVPAPLLWRSRSRFGALPGRPPRAAVRMEGGGMFHRAPGQHPHS
jgi:hypothetical protein